MIGFLRISRFLLVMAGVIAITMALGNYVPSWIRASWFALSLIAYILGENYSQFERWSLVSFLLASLTGWSRIPYYALIENHAADWLNGWRLIVSASLTGFATLIFSGYAIALIDDGSSTGLETDGISEFWYVILITLVMVIFLP